MSKFKRLFSMVLVIALLVSNLMIAPISAEAAGGTIDVRLKNISGKPGTTVDVPISIQNNPGIVGASFEIKFAPELKLENVTKGNVFSESEIILPGSFNSPYTVLWDSGNENNSNGTVATLTFHIPENAPVDSKYDLYLSCKISDKNSMPVDFTVENGSILVISFKPGDVNKDNEVDIFDLIPLRKFIVGGYNVSIDERAADVNDDGVIDIFDIIGIRRHIITGEELKPSRPKVEHTMQHVPAVVPTCTEDGAIEYWHCTTCNKNYNNAEGVRELSAEDIRVPKLGHDWVTVPGKEPTATEPGYTESVVCSRCHEVKVAPEPIPIPVGNIVYHIGDDDPYLKSIKIDNPNPDKYNSVTGLEVLHPLNIEGYRFLDWYDGKGEDAKRVTEIPAGTTKIVSLYARLEPIEYNVNFITPVGEFSPQPRYVNQVKTLYDFVPKWFGYEFVCWTDNNGGIVSEIPMGIAKDVTVRANWTSDRNKAYSEVSSDYAMYEDSENGNISFIYKLGHIENVPLHELKYIGNKVGLDVTEVVTATYSIDVEEANKVSQVVANATTRTSGWTLSSDWNKQTSLSEEKAHEVSQSDMDRSSEFHETTGQWNIGGSFGGGTTTTKESGSSSKYGLEEHGEAKFRAGPVKVKAGLKANQEWSKHSNVSNTDSSHWNIDLGLQGSASDSTNDEHCHTIASVTASKFTTGSVTGESFGKSSTASDQSSSSNSREYASNFIYSKNQTTTTTKTYSNANAPEGYYRLIAAGTVDVFAVVTYDIAHRAYYTETFSIMRDEIHEFVDYSKTGTFEDQENGILPFAVPIDIYNYVDSKVTGTGEFTVDPKTGIITANIDEPTPECDSTVVIIPEYVSQDKGTGNEEDRVSIRIKGFNPDVYAGNTRIKYVILPDSITEIPEGAFEGCTSLVEVRGKNITKIGANAFNGCTSMEKFEVSEKVTSLGDNAFKDVGNVVVHAADTKVAQAAINSGAKSLSLNIDNMSDILENVTYTIPASTDYFALIGGGKTFNGVQIKSDAKKTMINGMTLNNCEGIPVDLGSSEVILNTTTINAKKIALNLRAENTSVELYSENRLNTESELSMLSNNVSFGLQNQHIDGKLIADADVIICGKIISGDKYLVVPNGNIILSNSKTYNIAFDPNGGTVGTETKTVNIAEPVGDLPVPTKEDYAFCGWYTAAEGGELVTAETLYKTAGDITLFAHWKMQEIVINLNANGGSVSPTSKIAIVDEPIGELPTPRKDYCAFAGWFTEAEGGTQVTADTTYPDTTERTIYAHWTPNAVSGWVRADQMPADAQLVEEKWTYTQTDTFESKNTSESGCTQTGSRWEATGSGSKNYASFPSGFDHGHWIWKDFASSAMQGYENATSKRVVSDRWGGYVYWHWMYSVNYANTTTRAISQYSGLWDADGHSGKGANYIYFYAMTSTTDCPYLDKYYCCSAYKDCYDCHNILPSDKNGNHIGTPRFFRFNYRVSDYTDYVKMFSYERKTDKESSTAVSNGGNISNVQRWVKYRPIDAAGVRQAQAMSPVAPQLQAVNPDAVTETDQLLEAPQLEETSESVETPQLEVPSEPAAAAQAAPENAPTEESAPAANE